MIILIKALKYNEVMMQIPKETKKSNSNNINYVYQ